MSRRELIEAASKKLGVVIPPGVLREARRSGMIAPEPTTDRGWVSYPSEAVERLVAYCRFRSRIIAKMRQDGAKGGAR
jgi:hypothetical protein